MSFKRLTGKYQIHIISALLIIAFLEGCDWDDGSYIEDERTETVEVHSGIIIENETLLHHGRDRIRYNKLFIRRSPSLEREFIGKIFYEGKSDSLFELYKPPKLYCDQDRTVLTIGPYVFERFIIEKGPYWQKWNIPRNVPSLYFLYSFLDFTNVNKSEYLSYGSTIQTGMCGLYLYEIQRFDFDTNTFISKLKNESNIYPEFLVFSLKKGSSSLQYDHLRTLEKNEIEPISVEDLSLEMEVSVITYKGYLSSVDIESRESVLSAPKTKEIFNQRIIPNGKHWKNISFSFSLPDGTVIRERHDAVFGFFDSSPDFLLMFWQRHGACRVKLGEWQRISSIKYLKPRDGFSSIMFFRILRV